MSGDRPLSDYDDVCINYPIFNVGRSYPYGIKAVTPEIFRKSYDSFLRDAYVQEKHEDLANFVDNLFVNPPQGEDVKEPYIRPYGYEWQAFSMLETFVKAHRNDPDFIAPYKEQVQETNKRYNLNPQSKFKLTI